ncbi:MAG: DUF4055 domain-containing protein [Vulcanococcus sp.]
MYLHAFSHPTDDPQLVSYVRPELRALDDQLKRTRDCYSLMRSGDGHQTLSEYLPQEEGEPDRCYTARLNRSTYTSAFRDAIRAFAGVLSQYQLKELPSSVDDALNNVDLLGSSMSKFLNTLDQMVLRDGGVAVLVDMPQAQPVGSALEEIQQEIRPYLIAVERTNVINWRTRMVNGREVLESAVVRMLQELPTQDGAFGAELEPVYIHLMPGAFRKYRLERDAQRWNMILLEEGVTSLQEVPLVWYGATGSKFGSGEVPLIGMADLSIQHLQLRSDLAELIHKLSMPVPVRVGAPTDAMGRPMPLTLGPNSAVDLPLEGSFSFAEPGGGSLAQHQAEITHVEQLMDRSSLAFLYGGEGGNRTATEVMLTGAQVAAQVTTLTENKQSLFDQILQLWSAYTVEPLNPDAGLEVADNLIQRPLDPGESQALLGLFSANALSHQTLLEELQRGHVLSDLLDIEEELARVAEEKKKAQQEAMAIMQQASPGPEQFAPSPGPDPEEQQQPPRPEQQNNRPEPGA